MASTRRVRRVLFGVLSPEEVVWCPPCVCNGVTGRTGAGCHRLCGATRTQRRQSVVAVTKPETRVDGVPVAGGLYDPLMGAMQPREKCETCLSTYTGVVGSADCPGHFGRLEVRPPRPPPGCPDPPP